MFIFKKIIGVLLSPGVIILVLLSLGLLRVTFIRRTKQSGWFLFFLAILCFYFFTTAPLPQALLYPLENQYKPCQPENDIGKIDYIVVLSGELFDNSQVPPTSQLGPATAARVTEGIRLFHLFAEQPTLVMSGGGEPCSGNLMAAFAASLGVPAGKLLAETKSQDTFGNAVEVKPLVKESPFLLVTSASHLPRAMIIFKLLGMKPIPAPADFRVIAQYSWRDFFPSGAYLEEMAVAGHEYLGSAYLKLLPRQAGR